MFSVSQPNSRLISLPSAEHLTTIGSSASTGADIDDWEVDFAVGYEVRKVDAEHVGSLIAARNAARKTKDFKEADRIRDELSAMGIQLKDAKDQATGEIVTTWEVRASGATEVKR